MVRPTGAIQFDGQPMEGRATESIVRLGIAHVPEGRGTFTDLTVEENLRLGAVTRARTARHRRRLERMFGYFPRLGERRQQQAGTLSGGEQQMLAVARALMLRPRLMLLDEPSFGLAPLVVRELFRILRAINREDGVSILLVEQNAELALDLADHAYLIETGRMVMSGTAEDDAQRRRDPPLLSRILRSRHGRVPPPGAGRPRHGRHLRLHGARRGDDLPGDRPLNFAQGEMAMFSTFIAWQLMQWGMPYWGAFVTRPRVAFVGGVVIERVMFQAARQRAGADHCRRLHRALAILNTRRLDLDFTHQAVPEPVRVRAVPREPSDLDRTTPA